MNHVQWILSPFVPMDIVNIRHLQMHVPLIEKIVKLVEVRKILRDL